MKLTGKANQLWQRVTELERRDGGELPVLCLGQDWHDPELFRDAAGNEYRRGAPGWPDETRRQLVLVVYADDRRGDGEG